MDNKYVECAICHKILKSLPLHLKKKHDITQKEYSNIYIGAPTMAPMTKAKIALRVKSKMNTKAMREKMKIGRENRKLRGITSKKRIRIKHSEEGKKRISETMKEKWKNRSEAMIEGRVKSAMSKKRTMEIRRSQEDFVLPKLTVKGSRLCFGEIEKFLNRHKVSYMTNFSVEDVSYDFYLHAYSLVIAIDKGDMERHKLMAAKEDYKFISINPDEKDIRSKIIL